MRYQKLGNCFEASRLTLGGGGIGQVWGTTDRSEALATVRLAADSGINFFTRSRNCTVQNGIVEPLFGIFDQRHFPRFPRCRHP